MLEERLELRLTVWICQPDLSVLRLSQSELEFFFFLLSLLLLFIRLLWLSPLVCYDADDFIVCAALDL